jgi:hypothetical protein
MIDPQTVEIVHRIDHLSHDIPGLPLREAFVFCLFYAFEKVV